MIGFSPQCRYLTNAFENPASSLKVKIFQRSQKQSKESWDNFGLKFQDWKIKLNIYKNPRL